MGYTTGTPPNDPNNDDPDKNPRPLFMAMLVIAVALAVGCSVLGAAWVVGF